jgi:hypothetical protein
LLVAHAYTRYLGDLSGGQVLKRVAIKAMGLPDDGAGTEFYEFHSIPNATTFKDDYRRRLDETAVDTATADRIVAEANLAFVLNMRVFEELDVLGCEAEHVRPLAEVLATLDMPVDPSQKCPFSTMGGPNPHAKAEGGAKPIAGGTATKKGCPIPHSMLTSASAWVQPVLLACAVAVAAYFATSFA